MTGKEQYEQHLQGQKHAKKLKIFGHLSNQSDSPEITTTPVGQPVPGYSGKFVSTSEKSFASADSKGEVKKNGDANTAHQQPPPPPSLPRSLTTTTAVNQQPLSAMPGDDPVMNAVKANLMGSLPSKKPAYQGRCDVCNVPYTSKSHEEQHLSGKKHARKAQLQGGPTTLKPASFFCGFCNINVNSESQMDQHVSGTIHQKKVQQASGQQKRPQSVSDSGPSAAKKKFSGYDKAFIPPLQDPSQLMLQPLTYDK